MIVVVRILRLSWYGVAGVLIHDIRAIFLFVLEKWHIELFF
jgi:hypothetical protein